MLTTQRVKTVGNKQHSNLQGETNSYASCYITIQRLLFDMIHGQ